MEDSLSYFLVFLLVLVRITSFFATVPIFSHRSIPAAHKIGLSIALSLIIVPTIKVSELKADEEFVLLLVKECAVGLSLGLIAYMILMAIQIAGGLIDFQMGFTIANVIDPQSGSQSPLLGQYLYIISLLFLLSVDGHHLLIDGIYQSYKFIKIDQLYIHTGNEAFVKLIVSSFVSMFSIAVQMSMPVVGSIFLVDLALGIISRTVPQLNIFVVGFPIKIFISFAVLIVAMGGMLMVAQHIAEQMVSVLRSLMAVLGG